MLRVASGTKVAQAGNGVQRHLHVNNLAGSEPGSCHPRAKEKVETQGTRFSGKAVDLLCLSRYMRMSSNGVVVVWWRPHRDNSTSTVVVGSGR